MPISVEGIPRPPDMLKGDNPDLDPQFEVTEVLYRRCPPERIHQYQPGRYRVIPEAYQVSPHNLSVVRGKYAKADYARWDSELDPQTAKPQLYRDWFVIRIPVGEIPAELTSTGNVTFEFGVNHVPFDDLYSHSEIVTRRGGVPVESESKINKGVKSQYKTMLADRSVVVLLPEQIEEEQAVTEPAPAAGDQVAAAEANPGPGDPQAAVAAAEPPAPAPAADPNDG